MSVEVEDATGELRPEGEGDVSLTRWAAQREDEFFQRTFLRALELV